MRWSAVAAYAVLAGLLAAFNVDVLVGALSGDFAGIALVCGLLALAVSAAAHGLGHLGGPAGIVLAILTLLLVGMSTTGGAVTYEFEPGFYGAVSQLLPPGAALTAVRNVQYFDWAATLAPLAVLGAWAAGGLALGLLGERLGPHVRAAATRVSRCARRSSDRWFPRLRTERVNGAARRSTSGARSHSKRKQSRAPPPARLIAGSSPARGGR